MLYRELFTYMVLYKEAAEVFISKIQIYKYFTLVFELFYSRLHLNITYLQILFAFLKFGKNNLFNSRLNDIVLEYTAY